ITAAGHTFAMSADRHRVNRLSVASQSINQRSSLAVPEFDGLFDAGTDDPFAIQVDRDTAGQDHLSQALDFVPRHSIPDDDAVRTPADDAAAIGTDRYTIHGKGVSLERVQFLAGFGIPDLGSLVAAAAHDPLAIVADGDTRDRAAMARQSADFL